MRREAVSFRVCRPSTRRVIAVPVGLSVDSHTDLATLCLARILNASKHTFLPRMVLSVYGSILDVALLCGFMTWSGSVNAGSGAVTGRALAGNSLKPFPDEPFPGADEDEDPFDTVFGAGGGGGANFCVTESGALNIILCSSNFFFSSF